MKLKNKILLLIIFSILIFFITGLNVFATDLNTYVSPNSEIIKENLPIPLAISGDNYVRIITSQESSNNEYQYIFLYYFDKTLYDNFSKICLYEHSTTSSVDSFSLRPYTEDNKKVWTDSTCANFYGFYEFKTQDFLTYELYLHRLPDDYSAEGKPFISDSRNFISSNIDICDTDMSTVVFYHPLVEKGEQSFQEIIQGVKLEEITQTILAILPKIAIVVVSLIALLISSQLLWKQLKRS